MGFSKSKSALATASDSSSSFFNGSSVETGEESRPKTSEEANDHSQNAEETSPFSILQAKGHLYVSKSMPSPETQEMWF